MKRVLPYIFLAFLGTGCSFQTTVPAKNEYRLDVKTLREVYSSKECQTKVLQVVNIDSYDPVQSRGIYYAIGDYELFTYSKSNWQGIPSKAIKNALITALRQSGIFKDAASNRSNVQADLVLEYSVEDFMQYFTTDLKESKVTVKIHFSLLDAKNSKLLASNTIEQTLPSDTLDAIGGVKALSRALGEVLKENTTWLDTTCKKENR